MASAKRCEKSLALRCGRSRDRCQSMKRRGTALVSDFSSVSNRNLHFIRAADSRSFRGRNLHFVWRKRFGGLSDYPSI